MNTQLTVNELLDPLHTIIGVVENKQTLPILSHVLIQLKNGELTLTTTDMEIELRSSKKIQAQEEVSFTIYAKDLIDIIRKLNANTIIEFIIEESKIYIKTNNNSFELNTFNTAEFPSLPKISNSEVIKINRLTLKELIKKTSFSMGSQDIRAYLNGLYFEVDKNNIIVVATDGHRLSIGEIKQDNKLSDKKTVILPRKAVIELTKLLDKDENTDIDIHLSENYFHLKTQNTTIISRLIDGNFPNYAQVIPSNYENTVVVNRQDFLESLQQASIFVEERTKGVKLAFKDNQINIFSHSERGQAKTKIETNNFDKEVEISFNIHYLISILENLTTDDINMILPSSDSQSCLLSSIDDDTYQYVVMPMKI
ncbi:DNA polymerase III beta subunit (EC 2.7.7.7) [uncultured Gammaproteobacteria bacterium]|uniref:DNA polymerase III subunit beta n=1 Tax=Bathymodiolus heckerae thiotrophic gill symbiont TaxID=1052212 RepID=UPI0010B2FCA5|nr:DNA polymerase III subunit beta [Bathymodiolus heckerae thiotrophic gill symbiont]CAC9435122.1 DNA polymerase III beta subunit (EC 2.7.7.7) [uncultured Gammaproteobacteria bacterium]CAC9442311.1 DNA polymerase III beta subunit (EC 2.7.7.7) [uncultured Gammaproteobacteria bacterium]SMN13165.1 DNA polymerase III beta subunit [Bathymodiolus heckerae thiotrophic gill symbiont]